MQEVKKIIIIGPESTGKSTLCKDLGAHYNAPWCPEYAREYLLANGSDYSFEDLLTIAIWQHTMEEEYTIKAIEHWNSTGRKTRFPLLFVDTDMYVMKVWCEFVFGKCHHFILQKIAESKRDLYLLANIDLPWVKDELREYPDFQKREILFHIYKDILVNQSVPWGDVKGNYKDRTQAVIAVIDALFHLEV